MRYSIGNVCENYDDGSIGVITSIESKEQQLVNKTFKTIQICQGIDLDGTPWVGVDPILIAKNLDEHILTIIKSIAHEN